MVCVKLMHITVVRAVVSAVRHTIAVRIPYTYGIHTEVYSYHFPIAKINAREGV
jgi:hypothetical protein